MFRMQFVTELGQFISIKESATEEQEEDPKEGLQGVEFMSLRQQVPFIEIKWFIRIPVQLLHRGGWIVMDGCLFPVHWFLDSPANEDEEPTNFRRGYQKGLRG